MKVLTKEDIVAKIKAAESKYYKENPHNRKTNRLCGFFHRGGYHEHQSGNRVISEEIKNLFSPKKRHTQDRDMPAIGKQCAYDVPVSIRQEKIVRPKGDKNPS